MVLAITLHNIPEGLAVGVLFGGVAAGIPEATIGGAVALALGIGLQNFPEGIAVAMPFAENGTEPSEEFFLWSIVCHCRPDCRRIRRSCRSDFHAHSALCIGLCSKLAMIFVVVEEVIPEAQQNKGSDIATLGFIGGFIVMMTLDVALG